MLSDEELTSAVSADPNMRVYEYGVRLDPEAERHANDQVHKARLLYNEIVATTRSIYDEMQVWVLDRCDEPTRALHSKAQALSQAFLQARAANDEPAMKRATEERHAAWRELSPALAAVRKAHAPELRDKFYARIGANTQCETYALRCKAVDAGLGWATGNDVLNRALQAWKMSMKLGKPPRFSRGDEKDQDTLTLQFTAAGGVDISRLLDASHNELAIQCPEAGRRKYGNFRFRLGSASARCDATGTIQLHRPLPAGSALGARLVRRKYANKWKWWLQIVLRLKEMRQTSTPSGLMTTVHFGWAADVDGRRVAGIASAADPGLARLVQLPASIEQDLDRSFAIRSERDLSRDQAAIKLKALRDEIRPNEHERLDDETKAELDAVKRLPAQHIATRRFYRLLTWLRRQEVDVPWLATWVANDRKRWQAEVGIARRARGRRRDFYRTQALALARGFSAIVIEPLDLKKAAEKIDPATGERSEFTAKARAGRTVAAIYEFESEIRKASVDHDRALFELIAQETVASCAHCGSGRVRANENNAQELICNECGAQTDRKLAGAARAWQLSEPGIEDRIVEFHARASAARSDARNEKAARQARMVTGRAAARKAKREPGAEPDPA